MAKRKRRPVVTDKIARDNFYTATYLNGDEHNVISIVVCDEAKERLIAIAKDLDIMPEDIVQHELYNSNLMFAANLNTRAKKPMAASTHNCKMETSNVAEYIQQYFAITKDSDDDMDVTAETLYSGYLEWARDKHVGKLAMRYSSFRIALGAMGISLQEQADNTEKAFGAVQKPSLKES